MQSLAAQRYLNLSVDNDLYFGKDRYYSSGVFISLGKLKEGIGGNEATKKYVHWTLGQEIYTPTKRYTTDVDLFDYPYGGWLFLERTEEVQKNGNASWLWSTKPIKKAVPSSRLVIFLSSLKEAPAQKALLPPLSKITTFISASFSA
jgi:hypothetical protein